MVYETEYSTRRVYTSSSPRPNVATSYTYTINPISRRRNRPNTIGHTRVIRSPYPLGDQEILNLVTTPTRTTSRQYVSVDPPSTNENSSYKKSFSSTSSTSSSSSNSGEPGGRTVYKKTETTTSSNGSGPQTTSRTFETTRTDGATPSFFSSTSYRTPGQGTSFRHFSYK